MAMWTRVEKAIYITKSGCPRYSLAWYLQLCTWEAEAGGTAPTLLECQAKVSGILEWLFGVWYTEVGQESLEGVRRGQPQPTSCIVMFHAPSCCQGRWLSSNIACCKSILLS